MNVVRRGRARPGALLADEVHQVVDLEHVPAGEYAGDGGLHILVHHRAVGPEVHLRPQLPGQLVLRQEAHAQQQGIALEGPLRAGDGAAAFVYGGHDYLFQAFFADNVGDGVG